MPDSIPLTARPGRFRAILVCAALVISPFAGAQSWPEKPIRIVVPLPPGGPSDIVLRGAIEKMQPTLKQPLIVDNKPGAAGNLGAAEVARATSDGYTWLWTTDTLITVNPHVYEKLAFKPADLQPVMRATAFSQTLVCNPGVGVRTMAELVQRAKQKQISYASGGAGSPGHLTTELFSTRAGVQMLHVPYKGPAPAMQDVMGGQVDCGFLAGPTVLQHVRSGRLVALAVSGSRRSALLPDVPTVAESGIADFDASFSLVLFAPKGTPAAVIETMRSALGAALKQPDFVEKLRQSDQDVIAASVADTTDRLNGDAKKWGDVARKINLKLE